STTSRRAETGSSPSATAAKPHSDSRRASSSTRSRPPVAVLDVRGFGLLQRELLEPVVQPLEPLERRGIARAEAAEICAELPPGEADHPAGELIGQLERNHARVDEIAEVLVVHAGLDDRGLELRAERVDRFWRRVVGELEDLTDRAGEQLRRRRRAHEREGRLLLSCLQERAELHRRVDEEEHAGGRPDDVEQDLKLDRHDVPPPRGDDALLRQQPPWWWHQPCPWCCATSIGSVFVATASRLSDTISNTLPTPPARNESATIAPSAMSAMMTAYSTSP